MCKLERKKVDACTERMDNLALDREELVAMLRAYIFQYNLDMINYLHKYHQMKKNLFS